MKLIHAQIAECQRKLDAAKSELREAIVDLDIDDQIITKIRLHVKILHKELQELDFIMLRS